jgi:hypothetical protein
MHGEIISKASADWSNTNQGKVEFALPSLSAYDSQSWGLRVDGKATGLDKIEKRHGKITAIRALG